MRPWRIKNCPDLPEIFDFRHLFRHFSSRSTNRNEIHEQESDLPRRGTPCTTGFTKGSHFRSRCVGKMEGHYATRTQRMDLLGHHRQESGNQEAAH